MMHVQRLGMIGTTFRRGGQDGLSRFTLSHLDLEAREAALLALHRELNLQESVYVATCNRVELVFVVPPDRSVAQCRRDMHAFFRNRSPHTLAWGRAESDLHAFAGEGALERLFVVASALDSMVPGEAQILGQLKDAFSKARVRGCAGDQLSGCFAAAYAVAKKVRTETRLGEGVISMVSAVLGEMRRHVADAWDAGEKVIVGVVGTGDMARHVGQTFCAESKAQLLFVSREQGRADKLAQTYQGRGTTLAEFIAAPPALAVLVTATASLTPLFGTAFFHKLSTIPLVVDLAVGRDCVPEAARAIGARYLDIDALETLASANRARRMAELGRARLIVDAALLDLRKRQVDREMAPVTRALRDAFSTGVERSLQELQASLPSLDDPEAQRRFTAFAHTLVGRLAHVPTRGLKEIGYAHGVQAVDTFLTALGERHEKKPL